MAGKSPSTNNYLVSSYLWNIAWKSAKPLTLWFNRLFLKVVTAFILPNDCLNRFFLLEPCESDGLICGVATIGSTNGATGSGVYFNSYVDCWGTKDSCLLGC